jgi:hypothetical protein
MWWEESIQSTSQWSTATNLRGWEPGGWTSTPKQLIHVFEARSTEGGADCFVDRHALLGEVASLTSSLFRELTSQKSAAKQFG